MSLFIVALIFLILSAGLTWYFLSRDRGAKEPVAALWVAAGFGFLAAIIAGIIELKFIPANILDPNAYASTFSLFWGAIAVGLIEEVCKFIPLALYIYKKPYFNEYSDGIIYFAIAGLGFGVPENIIYSFAHGAKIGFLRVFMTPFFHAAMTALVGYYLISAKQRKKSLAMPAIALLATSLLHGLYDFGLLSAKRMPLLFLVSAMVTFSISVYLFVLYRKATRQDQADGDSAVGNNSFCRSCGVKNENHNLYCSSCGRRA